MRPTNRWCLLASYQRYRSLVCIIRYVIISIRTKYGEFIVYKLQRPQVPVQTFTIIPQSVTLLRLAYQGMYCLEIRLRGGGLVSLRDGAYSRFDRSNVVDGLI